MFNTTLLLLYFRTGLLVLFGDVMVAYNLYQFFRHHPRFGQKARGDALRLSLAIIAVIDCVIFLVPNNGPWYIVGVATQFGLVGAGVWYLYKWSGSIYHGIRRHFVDELAEKACDYTSDSFVDAVTTTLAYALSTGESGPIGAMKDKAMAELGKMKALKHLDKGKVAAAFNHAVGEFEEPLSELSLSGGQSKIKGNHAQLEVCFQVVTRLLQSLNATPAQIAAFHRCIEAKGWQTAQFAV
jgi:hypothetical protein